MYDAYGRPIDRHIFPANRAGYPPDRTDKYNPFVMTHGTKAPDDQTVLKPLPDGYYSDGFYGTAKPGSKREMEGRLQRLGAHLPGEPLSVSILGTTSVATISMYAGEDWSQTLTFYSDQAQTQPLVFTSPYLEIRDAANKYVTIDSSGTSDGTATPGASGLLTLTLPYAKSATIPPGTYDMDIFAIVSAKRKAILKQGGLQLIVTGRITQEP